MGVGVVLAGCIGMYLVVLLAEDDALREELKSHGIKSQTIGGLENDEDCPVTVLPAKRLADAYHYLGE